MGNDADAVDAEGMVEVESVRETCTWRRPYLRKVCIQTLLQAGFVSSMVEDGVSILGSQMERGGYESVSERKTLFIVGQIQFN